jgi:tRNA modification GTPase
MNPPAESAFAILTPPGRGGIAVIRCVGPGVEPAVAACFRRKSSAAIGDQLPPPGILTYGHIIEADGRAIDEVILFHAAAPPGPPCIHGGLMSEGSANPAQLAPGEYTGGLMSEPCAIFEINCHGGPAAVAAVGERLAALGLCEVEPDAILAIEGATAIELAARRLLRRAGSPLAARILLDQLGGALLGATEGVTTNLGEPSSNREVAGMPESAGAPAQSSSPPAEEGTRELTLAARNALAQLDALLARWHTCGRFIADPPRIVIAGRPNVGKSTLLNRLVGTDRAITSPVAGTTRDYVEAAAAIEGLPVILVDTAGLREASHEIEQAGVDRARAECARAAAVIYLVDACDGLRPEDAAAVASLGDRAVVAWNKVDAIEPAAAPPAGAIAISALTGAGTPALVAAVLARLGWHAPSPGEAVPFTPEQAAALRQARDFLAAGRAADARTCLAAVLDVGG